MKAALYARVSLNKYKCPSCSSEMNKAKLCPKCGTQITEEHRAQDVENQLDQLREFCQRRGFTIYHEYVDHESGGKSTRKAFNKLFEDAYQRRFQVVIYWALDRFSREGSAPVFKYIDLLESYGIQHISYQEPYFDTLGPFKDVVISIKATIAKIERDRISARVKAGIARAQRKGVKFGKDPVPFDLDLARKLKGEGKPLRAIAHACGVSTMTIKRRV